jgi:anthranilate synthase component 1
VKEAFANIKEEEKSEFQPDGKIIKQSDTLEEYSEKVKKIKQYIVDGHVFQTVLSQRWTIETKQQGFNLYKELREINPSPYMFYFSSEDVEIAGASPETLVKLEHDKLYTFPLAGTRKRGETEAEDQRLEQELLADEKERAEHNMLVDLGRNDIGKISRIASVEVVKYMEIERFSHVMHIGSTVTGTIREDKDAVDAVDAILPAGTLSGAPKLRACEIINELEDNKRGIYGGAIGYLDFTGNLDTCIAIRLAFAKNGKVYVRSGAGIVADSVPEKEYEECINKAKAVMNALKEADGGI